MNCTHCRQPITGDFERVDAGARLTTGDVIAHDANLCGGSDGCLGPWMLAHYPFAVGKVRTLTA